MHSGGGKVKVSVSGWGTKKFKKATVVVVLRMANDQEIVGLIPASQSFFFLRTWLGLSIVGVNNVAVVPGAKPRLILAQ